MTFHKEQQAFFLHFPKVEQRRIIKISSRTPYKWGLKILFFTARRGKKTSTQREAELFRQKEKDVHPL